jgi:hypothetical protein
MDDGSINHGFLSKYLLSRSQSSKSSFGVNAKFLAHRLNHIEQGRRPEALLGHYGLADEASVTVGSSHTDGKLESGEVIATPIVDSPFMTYSDKHFQSTARAQDMVEFTSARAETFRSSKDLDPQKIADKEEDKDVQKLSTIEIDKHIELFALGVALFSCVAMIGVRMRRRMQPAVVLASSGRHGIDMSIPMATISSDNTFYHESHCPVARTPEQILQSSERALANPVCADINSALALWDPLSRGEGAPEAHVRESERQHGPVSMAAVFFHLHCRRECKCE